MSVSDENINSAKRAASRINGVALHVMIQGQERNPSAESQEQMQSFCKHCLQIVRNHHGLSSAVSDTSFIGIFPISPDAKAELLAAEAANEIRNELTTHRHADNWPIVMRASINGGEVIFGNSALNGEGELLGSAIVASYQLLDTTQVMQITLTRRVDEALRSQFNTIARRPVEISNKQVQLYYLHLPC